MKLNISYPTNGTQKTFDIENDLLLRPFFEQRISTEVPGDSLGDEWKGYVFRITGGNDKQGFPMKQGVLTNERVRLLLKSGTSGYATWRRKGMRKRKSVRGCITDSIMSVIALVIIKKGDGEIAGLTDTTRPRRLGVKRATKIRKLFNLTKEDDVRSYVIKRKITREGKSDRVKAPSIQRLVTPQRLQRKRHMVSAKRARSQRNQDLKDGYQVLLAKLAKEKAEAKAAAHERRRTSSTRQSRSSESK